MKGEQRLPRPARKYVWCPWCKDRAREFVQDDRYMGHCSHCGKTWYRRKLKVPTERFCPVCGRGFSTAQSARRYCTPQHRQAQWLTLRKLEDGVRLLEQTEGRVAQTWEAA